MFAGALCVHVLQGSIDLCILAANTDFLQRLPQEFLASLSVASKALEGLVRAGQTHLYLPISPPGAGPWKKYEVAAEAVGMVEKHNASRHATVLSVYSPYTSTYTPRQLREYLQSYFTRFSMQFIYPRQPMSSIKTLELHDIDPALAYAMVTSTLPELPHLDTLQMHFNVLPRRKFYAHEMTDAQLWASDRCTRRCKATDVTLAISGPPDVEDDGHQQDAVTCTWEFTAPPSPVPLTGLQHLEHLLDQLSKVALCTKTFTLLCEEDDWDLSDRHLQHIAKFRDLTTLRVRCRSITTHVSPGEVAGMELFPNVEMCQLGEAAYISAPNWHILARNWEAASYLTKVFNPARFLGSMPKLAKFQGGQLAVKYLHECADIASWDSVLAHDGNSWAVSIAHNNGPMNAYLDGVMMPNVKYLSLRDYWADALEGYATLLAMMPNVGHLSFHWGHMEMEYSWLPLGRYAMHLRALESVRVEEGTGPELADVAWVTVYPDGPLV